MGLDRVVKSCAKFMFKVYRVKRSDLKDVLFLLQKCKLDFNRGVADLEKAWKISDVFLICKVGKMTIGVVRAVFDGYYCLMCELAVDPKFRRQGIGELLSKKAEEKLKSKGAKYIFLNASDEAVGFYRRIGYTKPKTNPFIKYLSKK